MALGGQPVHSTVVVRYLMLDDPVVLQVSQGVRQRTAVYRLSASNGEEVDQLAVTAWAGGQRCDARRYVWLGRLRRPHSSALRRPLASLAPLPVKATHMSDGGCPSQLPPSQRRTCPAAASERRADMGRAMPAPRSSASVADP